MCVSAGTEVATASAAAAVVNCTEGPGSVLYSEIASTDPGTSATAAAAVATCKCVYIWRNESYKLLKRVAIRNLARC